jgi:hypothetical protein
MSDIEQIAETIATEFTAAVKASNRAKQAKIDGLMSEFSEADARRMEGLGEVRRMQEEAAKIVAESLRLGEKIEAKYREDMRSVEAALNELRGPTVISSRKKPAIAAVG